MAGANCKRMTSTSVPARSDGPPGSPGAIVKGYNIFVWMYEDKENVIRRRKSCKRTQRLLRTVHSAFQSI